LKARHPRRWALWYVLVGAVMGALIALLVAPAPAGSGYTPTFYIFIALLIIIVPTAAWLAATRLPEPVPGRLPRAFWIGIALVGAAYCSAATNIVWHPGTPIALTEMPPLPPATGLHRTLRFMHLPAPIAAQFSDALPAFAVGRALRSTSGAYEVWLRRPGSSSYELQAVWQNGQIRLENLGFNSLYAPQAGPSLSALAARVEVPKGAFYGPVSFPGYLLYVSLTRDQYYLISRAAAGIAAEQEEAW
jgi:hypothetical protein